MLYAARRRLCFFLQGAAREDQADRIRAVTEGRMRRRVARRVGREARAVRVRAVRRVAVALLNARWAARLAKDSRSAALDRALGMCAHNALRTALNAAMDVVSDWPATTTFAAHVATTVRLARALVIVVLGCVRRARARLSVATHHFKHAAGRVLTRTTTRDTAECAVCNAQRAKSAAVVPARERKPTSCTAAGVSPRALTKNYAPRANAL